MCDKPNEYLFNDSFDESSGEYDSDFFEEDNIPIYHSLDDDSMSLDIDSEEEESHGVKRPREDTMELEPPTKKPMTDQWNNFNAMAMYAKAHDKESK